MSKGLSLEEERDELCKNGARRSYKRVTSGANKVEASMNAEVRLVGPQRLLLLSHVCFMLVIDEVDDWRPRVSVVDVVPKAGGVNDGQFDFELLLLQLGLDDFDLGQLVELLKVTAVVILRGRKFGRK